MGDVASLPERRVLVFFPWSRASRAGVLLNEHVAGLGRVAPFLDSETGTPRLGFMLGIVVSVVCLAYTRPAKSPV
jgi:hypothetical protein